MYLVALCTTTSAPRCSGCCRYGVAKVLSTHTIAPWLCAISLTASMSTTRSSGLVDDVEVGCVDGRELEAVALQDLVKEAKRAAVDVFHVDDPVAGVEQQHERGLRAHAGGKREAVLRALERGEALLEGVARRVAG